MDKNKLEKICRDANMRPEHREHFRDHDIFIADGFSLPPHAAHRRFGVEDWEYPYGMYATLWWVGKNNEKLDIGQALYFDHNHNPALDLASKKQARINAAVEEAKTFIKRREKASASVH